MRVEADAGEPLGEKASILTRRHTLAGSPTRKQEIARPFSRQLDVVVNRLAGRLGQLKPDGASGLFLAHRCTINCIAIGGNVIDFHSDDIAAPELAIDREIEEQGRALAGRSGALSGLPKHASASGVVLRPVSFPLFHGIRLAEVIKFSVSCIVILLCY
jgi:hypothetical protein